MTPEQTPVEAPVRAPSKLLISYAVYGAAQDFNRAAAEYLVSRVARAATSRGVARIAISGGNTPRALFELLADQQQPFYAAMPWQHLQIYWVDERCVPPDNQESNFRMTRDALLQKVPLTDAQVFRMEGELKPEEGAARYESVIRRQFRLEGAELPRFDVVALGMGNDGHTASLFPHTEALHEMNRIVVANHVPQKDTWRITLTSPVINKARDIFFLVEGTEKAEALQKVLTSPLDVDTLPSQLIRPQDGTLVFLLDSAAAAKLPPPGPSGLGAIEVSA